MKIKLGNREQDVEKIEIEHAGQRFRIRHDRDSDALVLTGLEGALVLRALTANSLNFREETE